MPEERLYTWIYRSNRKDEMYLYLKKQDAFDEVPEALMKMFGEPSLVIALELSEEKKLAREDAQVVIKSLHEQGFFLQMPPNLEPDLYDGPQ